MNFKNLSNFIKKEKKNCKHYFNRNHIFSIEILSFLRFYYFYKKKNKMALMEDRQISVMDTFNDKGNC